MNKMILVFIILIMCFTGCASVLKNDAAGNVTEKEKREQAISVNILDTLLGAGAGLFAGALCGGFITLLTGQTWFENPDARMYVPLFIGVAGGGFIGYLLSPKYEENSR